MKAVHSTVSLEVLCTLFDKSRQAYYKMTSKAATRQEWHGQILEYIKKQRKEQPRIGTDKLQQMLRREVEIEIGRDALYNLLRANRLLIKQRKKYHPQLTDGDGNSIYPDLRKEVGPAQAANRFWSSDITYLKLHSSKKHGYATFVVDEYSHLIVGFTVAENMTAQATLQALEMAVASQGVPPACRFNFELIFHSDRGSQFKSALLQNFLATQQIRPSMTKDGKASDNPVSERLNGIIKNELLEADSFDHFDSFEQAVALITRAVRIYNTRRPHRSCNMLTPQQAHQKGSGPLKKLWKQRKKTAKATKVFEA